MTNKKEFYNGIDDERTKSRLKKIEKIGMEEVSYGEFGFKGITSGFYIENIWHFSDKEFEDYIKYCLTLKRIFRRINEKK